MRFRYPLCILFMIAVLLGPSTTAIAGASWSQWRGPHRDGRVEGEAWPASLAGLELEWRIPLGKGYPGPVLSADRVFVVETVDDEQVAVRSLDRENGKEIWRKTWNATGDVPFFANANGDWVRSTPAFDGETLFVGDMMETLVALDGETGTERWRVSFPERYGTDIPDFGFASSPLLDGDHLYVQAANSVLRLDPATGETVWRTLAGNGKIQASGAFSSPVIATIAGERQLVVATRHALHGVGLDTGDVLWSREVPNFRGMNILTPTVQGDRVFTSSYRNGSFLYSIKKGDSGYEVEETWTNKASGYMSSPVLIDGHVYLHLGNGRVDCIDAATGESRWRSEAFGKYWSMTFQGQTILALDERGSLHLVRASPKSFELVDSLAVDERATWGYLAVDRDQVFVRGLEAIAAYRWRAVPDASTATGAAAGSQP